MLKTRVIPGKVVQTYNEQGECIAQEWVPGEVLGAVPGESWRDDAGRLVSPATKEPVPVKLLPVGDVRLEDLPDQAVTCKLSDTANKTETIVRLQVVGELGDTLFLSAAGYGDYENGEGGEIAGVELWGGELRIIHWPDINSEEAGEARMGNLSGSTSVAVNPVLPVGISSLLA